MRRKVTDCSPEYVTFALAWRIIELCWPRVCCYRTTPRVSAPWVCFVLFSFLIIWERKKVTESTRVTKQLLTQSLLVSASTWHLCMNNQTLVTSGYRHLESVMFCFPSILSISFLENWIINRTAGDLGYRSTLCLVLRDTTLFPVFSNY